MAVHMDDNTCTATIRSVTVPFFVRSHWAASHTSLASWNGTQTGVGYTARVATSPFAECRTHPQVPPLCRANVSYQAADQYVTSAGNTKCINRKHEPDTCVRPGPANTGTSTTLCV